MGTRLSHALTNRASQITDLGRPRESFVSSSYGHGLKQSVSHSEEVGSTFAALLLSLFPRCLSRCHAAFLIAMPLFLPCWGGC